MSEAAQSPQEVALGGMRRPRIPFQRFGARRRRRVAFKYNNNNKKAKISQFLIDAFALLGSTMCPPFAHRFHRRVWPVCEQKLRAGSG